MVAQNTPGQSPKDDPLRPRSFLEGTWYGEGKSPYGPYEFEARNERPGRWMLCTSSIYTPGTDRLSFVATGLIGYEDKGLVMYALENAGITVFPRYRYRSVEEPGAEWRRGYQRRSPGLAQARLVAARPEWSFGWLQGHGDAPLKKPVIGYRRL